MERDRLKRKLKRQAVRNTILVFLGIGVIVALLFFFGQQLLINFSLLLSNNRNDSVNVTEQNVSYIAPPDLDPAEEATNSARINVSGSTSIDNTSVKLYVNDILADTTNTNDKNEFRFRNIELEKGENILKAKTVTEDGKESSFSDHLTITYSDKAPEISIDYPQNGQTLKNKDQKITGKTDAGSTVTVNGFRAIVDPNGNFSYNIKLNDGSNTIKFVTTDSAGNKTEKEITVTYAP